MQSKRTELKEKEKKKRLHECSKGRKIEDSLEPLMRGKEGEIVEDSFEKI